MFPDAEKASSINDGGLFGDLPEPSCPKGEKRKKENDDDTAPDSKRRLHNDGNCRMLHVKNGC